MERARDLLDQARSLAKRLDLPRELNVVHLTSAYIELVGNNADEAELHLASARQAVDESGTTRLLAALLLAEAALRARRGEIDPAIETWNRAGALARELGADWDPEDRLLIEQVLEPLRSLRPEGSSSDAG